MATPLIKKGSTDFRSGGVKTQPPTKITWRPPPSRSEPARNAADTPPETRSDALWRQSEED
jgi:hypothetical protein